MKLKSILIVLVLSIMSWIGCNNKAENYKSSLIPELKQPTHHDSMVLMFHAHDSVKNIKNQLEQLAYRYFDTSQMWVNKSIDHLYTNEFDYYINKAKRYQKKAERLQPQINRYYATMDSILKSVK